MTKECEQYLARRVGRAKSDKARHSLLTNVESRAADLVLVDLVDEDGGQHADDDLVLVLDLRESTVESIEIGGSDES